MTDSGKRWNWTSKKIKQRKKYTKHSKTDSSSSLLYKLNRSKSEQPKPKHQFASAYANSVYRNVHLYERAKRGTHNILFLCRTIWLKYNLLLTREMNDIYREKKWEIQVIVFMIMVIRSSERIFNPISYTGMYHRF